MAHFAKLKSMIDPTGFTSDIHLVVLRVHVVGNDNPANGGTIGENDMHVDGETFCEKFYKGGIWKQTSYNNNFRKQYAGIGYSYDASKDKFIQAQPYPSWALDSNDDWQAPVTYPSATSVSGNDLFIRWDEDNLRWIGSTFFGESEQTDYIWDASSSAWNEV